MHAHGRRHLAWSAPPALGAADPDLRHVRAAVRVAPALGGDVERGSVLLRALPAPAALMSKFACWLFSAGGAGRH